MDKTIAITETRRVSDSFRKHKLAPLTEGRLRANIRPDGGKRKIRRPDKCLCNVGNTGKLIASLRNFVAIR